MDIQLSIGNVYNGICCYRNKNVPGNYEQARRMDVKEKGKRKKNSN